MTKPRIRPAAMRDLDDLVRVDRRCFVPGIAFDRAEIRHYLSRSDTGAFLARIDGVTAGYAIVSLGGKPPCPTLVTLDVVAEHRRMGLGSALLAACERWLVRRGAARIELQVDTANHGAIRFYLRHGFRASGKIPGYYPTGSDAYLMQKGLARARTQDSNRGLSLP